jgi:hypothetical protein
MNTRDECPVLDLLESSGDPGKRLLSDLKESIPERGPPKNNPEASKALRDSILELREPVSKGGTLRVLYFYDKGRVIVCANGILKKSNKTPDDLIDAAVRVRNDYMAAVQNGQLEIVDPPTETPNGADCDVTH